MDTTHVFLLMDKQEGKKNFAAYKKKKNNRFFYLLVVKHSLWKEHQMEMKRIEV